MPYAAPYLKIVMSGTTYPGEIFSTGLQMIAQLGQNAAQPADIAPYVAACKAWFSRADSRISAIAKLDTVKVNLIGVDGRYTNPAVTFFEEFVPVPGGGQAGGTAAQLTLAVTFVTIKKRGLAHIGRMYPPLSAPGVGADGLVPESAVLEVAGSATQLVNALNAIGPSMNVGLVSPVRTGDQNGVTGVEVGRTIDTQRRRRHALSDDRVASATPVSF